MNNTSLSDQLKIMKEKSGKTFQQISEISNIPSATVQKNINGDVQNPSLDIVYRLVEAMGFTIHDLFDKKPGKNEKETSADIAAVKEAYEQRIKDLKESNEKHTASLTRDKKLLTIALAILGTFILGVLIFDLLHGGVGYVRY